MPKRKHKDKEDAIQRKIAKYEGRLAKDREGLVKTPELDPELKVSVDPELEDSVNQDQITETDPIVDQDHEPEALVSDEVGVAQELDNDFLSALGETSSGARQYGEEIHEEIYKTVYKILIEGISKPNKDKLMESLLIPRNCKLLDAPKLNTELLAVLNNPSRTRDKLMEDRQQEMGLAIGCICTILNTLSKRDFDKYNVIKKLTDVSRILSHLHFQYTEIRKKLVNPFLDKNLVESLKDNTREEFLYSNLDNSVKSYSAIKRAANVIKTKPVHTAKNLPVAKNFQQPPRRPNPINQVHPVRGSYRGAHRYNTPRQPFRPMDNKLMGQRGRARYP